MGRGGRGDNNESSKMRESGSTRDALLDRQKAITEAYSSLREAKEKYRKESAPLLERIRSVKRIISPMYGSLPLEIKRLKREIEEGGVATETESIESKEKELERYKKELDELQEELDELEEPLRQSRSHLNEEIAAARDESRNGGKQAFENLAKEWTSHLQAVAGYERSRKELEKDLANRSYTKEQHLEFQRRIDRLNKSIIDGQDAPSAKDIESLSEEEVETLTPRAAREEALRQEAESMDAEEFMEVLSRVDWYYYFSDDPAAESRGKQSYNRAKALAANDPQKQKMFEDYEKYARQKTSGEEISRPEPSNYV